MPPLRLLTFTTLYPHGGAPNLGVFVENRLRHLVATGQATSLVVAPVPWVPPLGTLNPAWASWAGALPVEQRHGITVQHPRYPSIPKIGMNIAPWLLYQASWRAVARHMRQTGQRFDVIDAHYAYPDGVAATWLGRRLGLPVVITVRGSDVTEYPAFAVPRRLIRRAFADAAAIVTVSAGLRDAVVALGTSGDKVSVLRNGVDLAAIIRQPAAAPC